VVGNVLSENKPRKYYR